MKYNLDLNFNNYIFYWNIGIWSLVFESISELLLQQFNVLPKMPRWAFFALNSSLEAIF